MSVYDDALKLHKEHRGKIAVVSKVPLRDRADLSVAYTPGVAEPCRVIHKDPEQLDVYTSRWNMVAVVSDGSAVLGLGNIGARAAMPVMEGKAVLFKELGGVDAFPICLETQDPDEIIRTVRLLEPSFGGVNLEDIAAPNCFYIEQELKKICGIPIFHDDQHGTAIVVSAGLMNAAKLTDRKLSDLNIVINGAGAAGIAVARLLFSLGVGDITMCDSKGCITLDRDDLNPAKREMATLGNKQKKEGPLPKVMKGANVFIGVSKANLVDVEMVRSMDKDAIIFAMANPDPEVLPDVAKEGGAKIVCTGRSDYPNQVNNVMGFPGIFRGALDVRATDINDQMKLAAARALAALVGDDLREDYVLPNALDPRIVPAVAAATAEAAIASGVARVKMSGEQVAQHTRELVSRLH